MRFSRKFEAIRTRYCGQFLSTRAARMAGCHAASKADFMSRKTQAANSFASMASSIKMTREWPADSVDRPDMKPF